MKKVGFVYILATRKGGTLYVGMTTDLSRRIEEHRRGEGSEFTSKYGVARLVWFETFELITQSIIREKTIKKWPRQWKINLIEETNPHWQDIRSRLF
jgi:putative endonuclease